MITATIETYRLDVLDEKGRSRYFHLFRSVPSERWATAHEWLAERDSNISNALLNRRDNERGVWTDGEFLFTGKSGK